MMICNHSPNWRLKMWFVHTTGKTWYKVLYQHTMYVISLSNISIKTNLYNTLGETTFCAWRHVICCSSFFCFACVAYIEVFSPQFNDMTSWENSSAEKISCNIAPYFYHQCGDTTFCIRQATFFKFKGKRTNC